MLTTIRRGAVAAAAALMLAAMPLAAVGNHHHSPDHEQATKALAAGEVLPLRTVLKNVQQQYPGRVVNVHFERDQGAWVYRIRLLQKQGRLVKLKIDAGTGKVIDVKSRSVGRRGKR